MPMSRLRTREAVRWLMVVAACAIVGGVLVIGVRCVRSWRMDQMTAGWLEDLESPRFEIRLRAESMLVQNMDSGACLLLEALPSLDGRAAALAIAALIRAGFLSEAERALSEYAKEHDQLSPSCGDSIAEGLQSIVAATRSREWGVPLQVVAPWLHSHEGLLRKTALAMASCSSGELWFAEVLGAISDPDASVRAQAIQSANQIVHRAGPDEPRCRTLLLQELVARYAATGGQLQEDELARMTVALLSMTATEDCSAALRLLRGIVGRSDVCENTRAIAAVGVLRDAGIPDDDSFRISEAERVKRAVQILERD